MADVVRTKRADADLADSAFEGTRRWGAAAAVEYVEGFAQVWQLLRRYPRSGRRRDDVGVGVRSWGHRSHIVYYRIDEGSVLVLRILHGAADSSELEE